MAHILQETSFKLTPDFGEPILATLLQHRAMSMVIIGAAAYHAGAMVLGLPSWHCPLRRGLGVPCPGCGLSRGIEAFIHSDFETSFKFNAFAPLFLLALMLITLVTFLPQKYRQRAINYIGLLERRTAITAIFLAGLVLYWLARLAIMRGDFIQLING